MDKPLVSVIVPVHNSEKHLRKMLDALIFQTLQEIEIILVENSSTDGTLDLLAEYKEKYPKKIIYESIPEAYCGASGRNRGIELAKADYLFICDSDDFIEHEALDWLYQTAIRGNFDLVCAPAYDILVNEKRISGTMPYDEETGKITMSDLIQKQIPSFWTKLIHRSLIEKMGKMPEDLIFDDISYILPLSTYAKNPGYVDKPIYHYFRHGESLINSPFTRKVLDTITAEKYALDHCNQEYREFLVLHLSLRIKINIKFRWYFLDKFIDWLVELWDEIEQSSLKDVDPERYRMLNFYRKKNNYIPRRIYLNGFNHQWSEAEINEIRTKSFIDDCEIVILNEDNCKRDEDDFLDVLYENDSRELIGQYFALKEIFRNGGFYLDYRVKIDSPFHYLRCNNAFFGFKDSNNYTDLIFGARANNNAVQTLLNTFNVPFYQNWLLPLSQRLKTILTAKYDIPLNGENFFLHGVVTVYNPSVLTIPKSEPNPKIVQISHLVNSNKEEEYVILPESGLEALRLTRSEEDEELFQQLESELYEIKNSGYWKLTKPLRKLAESRFRKRSRP